MYIEARTHTSVYDSGSPRHGHAVDGRDEDTHASVAARRKRYEFGDSPESNLREAGWVGLYGSSYRTT